MVANWAWGWKKRSGCSSYLWFGITSAWWSDGVKEQEGKQKEEQGVRWGWEILNSRGKLFPLSRKQNRSVRRPVTRIQILFCQHSNVLHIFFCFSLSVYVEEMKEFWGIFRRLGNEFFSSEILGGSQSEIEGKPPLVSGPQAEGKLPKGWWCRAPRDD